MSMLGSQVDRLRTAAQTERALGHYELEQMLLDAADTIWELRDDLQMEHSENASLRGAAEGFSAENAKLRKLCHDLRKEYAYLRARPRRFYVQHEARMAAIDARMRELGVEVEG